MKVFVALLATGLLLAALSSGTLRELPNWKAWEAAGRGLAGAIALGLAIVLFVTRRGRLAREEPTNRTPAYPYPEWLNTLWADAARRITSSQQPEGAAGRGAEEPAADLTPNDYRLPIAIFTELIANAAKHRVRVAETVEVEGLVMVQRVTVEFDLPPGWDQAKFLYLPVLHPLKGELVDNFHLRDAGDQSLADLTYEETTRLAASGLRLLVAFGNKAAIDAKADSDAGHKTPSSSGDWLDNASQQNSKELVTLLAMRGRVDIEAMQRTADEYIDKFELDELAKNLLRRYVLELCGAYPIVAVVDPSSVSGGRVLVKYQRTLMPVSLAAIQDPDQAALKKDRWARRVKGWRGLVRIAMGLRPSQVGVPISLALTSSSYHLRLNAPENKYVFEQHLMCSHCEKLVEASWAGAKPDHKKEVPFNKCAHTLDEATISDQKFDDRHYFRLQRRRGQNFVHLYMRGFGAAQPKMDGLQVVARFKEVPPGSRFQAAATALATTVLIIVVGYLVSNRRVSPGSDYPALVLALPAVVASWFGIASERNALVGGSLLARLSLIVSGVLSLASIVTYLMTAPTSVGHLPRPQVSLLGVTHKAWITLAVLSLVNFVYLYYRFVLKLVHYRDLMRRTQGPGFSGKID